VNAAPALVAPLVIQAVAMGFDELHFHRVRGLGHWERVGHPLDTLTMLACVGWVWVVNPTERNIAIYVGLATISCLFITKDELVHARTCSPGEHWVHALLFVVHPLTLLTMGLLWPALHPPRDGSLWQLAGGPELDLQAVARSAPSVETWLVNPTAAARVVAAEFAMAAGFCLFQALYWNVPWPRRAPPIP
jgi:hypothetical protein